MATQIHTPTISHETEPIRLDSEHRSSLAKALIRLGLAVMNFYWEHRDCAMSHEVVGALKTWLQTAEDATAAHWQPLYDACATAERDPANECREVRQALADGRHALMYYLAR